MSEEIEKKDAEQLLEEKRAARKAERHESRKAQRIADLEALDNLEQEHGDSCVTHLIIDRDDLPTMAIARCPVEVEVKRFRDRVKKRKESDPEPDAVAAAEQVANVCLLYPSKEVFEVMCKAVPNLRQQLGVQALKLATGKTEAEGKG